LSRNEVEGLRDGPGLGFELVGTGDVPEVVRVRRLLMVLRQPPVPVEVERVSSAAFGVASGKLKPNAAEKNERGGAFSASVTGGVTNGSGRAVMRSAGGGMGESE
jgi:hypothetical protein